MTPIIYRLQKHEQNRKNIATLIHYSTEQEINEADSLRRTPLNHLARLKKPWDHGFLTEITKASHLINLVQLTISMQLLLEHGAKSTSEDMNGNTPEDVAKYQQNTAVLKILREEIRATVKGMFNVV